MCTFGVTFYVCSEGCSYNHDKVPGHSQEVRCFPCAAAVGLARENGVVWKSLPIGENQPFCCPRGSATSDETIGAVVEEGCEDCFLDLPSSDEEDGEEEGNDDVGQDGDSVYGVEEDDEGMEE